jgi:hypothetical protein
VGAISWAALTAQPLLSGSGDERRRASSPTKPLAKACVEMTAFAVCRGNIHDTAIGLLRSLFRFGQISVFKPFSGNSTCSTSG